MPDVAPFRTLRRIGKDRRNTITSHKSSARSTYSYQNLRSGTPAPLIVLLHGSGRNGLSLEKWKDLAAKEGIIIVGPDALNSAAWSAPVDGPDFLRDLVEQLKSKYPIDPHRVYLFGHSGGAVFALYMSLFESQYFAATAIHAGAIAERPAILSQSERFLAMFVGTKDPLFPLANVRGTRDDLTKQGFAADLTEIPGHDHWYYDLAPKINQSAWEFLKKHQLNEDPQYEEYRWNK